MYGADDSLSSHINNRTNDFFVWGERPTNDIIGRISAVENTFGIDFSKAKTKFCLNLHHNRSNSFLPVKGKNFEADSKYVNFPSKFFWEAFYGKNLIKTTLKKYPLKVICTIVSELRCYW